MKNLKSNEEFAQEVLRRGNIHIKKRRKMAMTVCASLVIVVASAAVFAANGYGNLPSNNLHYSEDMAISNQGAQLESQETDSLDSQIYQESFTVVDKTEVTDRTDNATEPTDTDQLTHTPCAEVYHISKETEGYANVIIPEFVNRVYSLIESAKSKGVYTNTPGDDDITQSLPQVSADDIYKIVLSDEGLDVYYLRGNILTYENAGESYELSQSDADALRDELDIIMKGR